MILRMRTVGREMPHTSNTSIKSYQSSKWFATNSDMFISKNITRPYAHDMVTLTYGHISAPLSVMCLYILYLKIYFLDAW